MDLQLKGKVALITGSTKGIGRQIAETLADEGCHLGICARNADEVDAAVSALSEKGVKVVGGVVDSADGASLEAWVNDCATQMGGIDIFVSNVSAGNTESSESGWRLSLEADMLGTWRGVQLVLPWLEKSSSGSIIVISSTAALEAFAGAVPYGAIKAALLNYAGNLANELAGKNIRVNAVSPGPIYMEGGAWEAIKAAMPEIYEGTVAQIPMGRMGTPSEVSTQVALLASPLSGFTTGTNVVIDGGFTKRLQF